MGQQHRKYLKRSRRKAYISRKKALARQGNIIISRPVKNVEEEPAKKVVKKKAAKKTAVKATVETPETTAE